MYARSSLAAFATPIAILVLTCASAFYAAKADGYVPFIVAMVALTAIVGTGLNVLVGLTGQVSLGHVGFYAIGAYTVAILTLKGVSFWIALPLAGVLSAAIGFLLSLPALRVTGPYLAMVTIAFAFIVQHLTIEWRGLTGGSNGLMNLPPPTFGGMTFTEREIALFAVGLAGIGTFMFHRLANSAWGKAMVAVRDAEIAARSIGLNPVSVKAAAFMISAGLTGIAGGVFASLLAFVAPDSFPFSQSILFLFSCVVGGAGWVLGPVVGAVITVVLPEALSSLAEYRLLFFGALLLVVLWLAPQGVLGSTARMFRRIDPRSANADRAGVAAFLAAGREPLEVTEIGITFGGIKAATGVSFKAAPGQVTSVIGPNGAGKTTVLNMIGGFYKPDTGSIRLGGLELAAAPAWKVARAGIGRTYQTTKLFESMSVLDNVLIAMRNGRLGSMVLASSTAKDETIAEALVAFVGYKGALAAIAGDLAHVDRRLVEIARALAMRPSVLLLDEPAAGLMSSDKEALSDLLRRIADVGIAVILVEHDMPLVMGISDHIVVLDAGKPIASGTPNDIRSNPKVLAAYLGAAEMKARPRTKPWNGAKDAVLTAIDLTAGYGAAPVLQKIGLDVRPGELVALIGTNGAGKSTMMLALSGLLRPVNGEVILNDQRIEHEPAHMIAVRGLALVPEGRQVFPELSVYDNLELGANTRKNVDYATEIEALLERFPRLRDRINSKAGLLSGGEQQMLAIARGMMAKPRILLLDEPSLGLAPAMIQELFDVLADLRDEGITILLVDQMATLALAVADRAYVIDSGKIVREDSAAVLASDPQVEAAYLGHLANAQ